MRMQSSKAATKENQSSGSSKKTPNWELIRSQIRYLEDNGAEVVNQHKKPRTVKLPQYPGLKLLAAADSLINYGGFIRLYDEDELTRLTLIRSGYNVADI